MAKKPNPFAKKPKGKESEGKDGKDKKGNKFPDFLKKKR